MDMYFDATSTVLVRSATGQRRRVAIANVKQGDCVAVIPSQSNTDNGMNTAQVRPRRCKPRYAAVADIVQRTFRGGESRYGLRITDTTGFVLVDGIPRSTV